MKRLKRVGILLLAICMMLGAVPMPALAEGFTDAGDYDAAIRAVTALEIMEGENDTQFFPEDALERSELIRAMVRLWNQPDVTDGKRHFTDVAANHYAAKEIDQAVHLGLISVPDTKKLSPKETVTVEEAAEMLLKVMNYGTYLEGSRASVLTVANRAGLLDGVGSAGAMTEGKLARMIYNSFYIGMLEQVTFGGEDNRWEVGTHTTLYYHGLQVQKGLVYATERSNLFYTGEPVSAGQILIGSTLYQVGETNAADYLGYEVEFYCTVKGDGAETIRYIYPTAGNTTLEIDAENLAGADNNQIRYYTTGGRETSVAIGTDICMIYNGVAIAFDSSLIDSMNCGSLLLIDNGYDLAAGRYDVIVVSACESFVVQNVRDAERIYFRKGTLAQSEYLDVSEDADKTVSYFLDGKETNLSAVTAGCVIRVEHGSYNGTTAIKVYISNKKAEVTMTSLRQVDGKNTLFAGAEGYVIDANCVGSEKIEAGKTLMAYFDDRDHILMVEEIADSLEYACYLQNRFDDFSDKLTIQILNQSGAIAEIWANKKVRVTANGVETGETPAELHARLQAITEVCLVKVCADSDGRLTRMMFAQDETADKLYNENNFTKHPTITSSQTGHYNLKGINYTGCTSFVVPAGKANEIDLDLCKVSTSYFSTAKTYNSVTFYDIGIKGRATAALVRDSAKPSISDDDYEGSLLVVQDVLQTLNAEGQRVNAISGLQGGNEVTLVIADENTNDQGADRGRFPDLTKLETGDVLCYATNAYGEIAAWRVAYNNTRDKDYTGQLMCRGAGYTATMSATCTVLKGAVDYMAEDLFTINLGSGTLGARVNKWSGVNVYLVDRAKGEVTVTDSSAILPRNFYNNIPGSEVVLRTSRNVVSEVIIYED